MEEASCLILAMTAFVEALLYIARRWGRSCELA